MSNQADDEIGWRYYAQSLGDELAHIEDMLRTESPVFDIEHTTDDCTCAGKRCSSCRQTLCLGAFWRNRSYKDGLQICCRACHGGQIKKSVKSDLERIVTRNAAYRQKHPERQQLWHKNYRNRHPEADKAYDRANRQKHNEHWKAWLQANPEKKATYQENRRTRKMQAEGSFTSQEWKALKIRYNYTCLCCGRQEPEIKLTVDHVVPLSKGGTNDVENI